MPNKINKTCTFSVTRYKGHLPIHNNRSEFFFAWRLSIFVTSLKEIPLLIHPIYTKQIMCREKFTFLSIYLYFKDNFDQLICVFALIKFLSEIIWTYCCRTFNRRKMTKAFNFQKSYSRDFLSTELYLYN